MSCKTKNQDQAILLHNVLEQRRDRLAIVVPTNCFRKEIRQVKNMQLRSVASLFLWDGVAVCHEDVMNGVAILQLLKTVSAKDGMSGNAVDLLGQTTLDNRLGSSDPRTRLVDHVVNNEDGAVLNVSDKGDHVLHLGILQDLLILIRTFSCITRAAESGVVLRVQRSVRHGHRVVSSDTGGCRDGRRLEVVRDDVAVDKASLGDLMNTLVVVLETVLAFLIDTVKSQG